MYEKILARSFSRYEQRKLGYGAFFACLLVVASFCTVFKPYLGPLPILNLRMSMDSGLKMLMTNDASKLHNKDFTPPDNADGDLQAENRTMSSDFTAEAEKNITVEPETDAQTDSNALQPTSDQGDHNVTVLKPSLVDQAENISLPLVVENVTMTADQADQAKNTTMVQEVEDRGEASGTMKSEISCNFALPRSNSCNITGDVRVSGISGTILVPRFELDPSGENSRSWKIKPYARKTDQTAMEFVREWSVKSVFQPKEVPECSVTHTVPAIVFSNSGYSGNHFHDFTDTLIPLFLGAKKFQGEVKFLVTNYRLSWLNKYRKILKKLSKYEIIDIDKEVSTHCFPNVILGLTSQKELDVDPSMPPYSSQQDFTRFVRDAYSLPRSAAIDLSKDQGSRKPRLMIISRKATRRLINIGRVVKMAKRVGYKVVVAEGNNSANLAKFAESVNSCDVLLGVHGAGLTNMVFLPRNAVLVQIVPLGLEWLSDFDFGQPARDMGLNYLDYGVTKEESSLIQQFPADHIVFTDPYSFQKKGWFQFRTIYLDKQDIKVDVKRLQPLLVKAMELLHR
uniref:Glycosyltransferase 61 catalytic domain-containing protein n=1 Tax=Kalanchoe fedtschenkoi TaxID=63787 RepID=A0A7N0UW22_KALFE